jgi:hypothetical protein
VRLESLVHFLTRPDDFKLRLLILAVDLRSSAVVTEALLGVVAVPLVGANAPLPAKLPTIEDPDVTSDLQATLRTLSHMKTA